MSEKTVPVSGYENRHGTYVEPYMRGPPTDSGMGRSHPREYSIYIGGGGGGAQGYMGGWDRESSGSGHSSGDYMSDRPRYPHPSFVWDHSRGKRWSGWDSELPDEYKHMIEPRRDIVTNTISTQISTQHSTSVQREQKYQREMQERARQLKQDKVMEQKEKARIEKEKAIKDEREKENKRKEENARKEREGRARSAQRKIEQKAAKEREQKEKANKDMREKMMKEREEKVKKEKEEKEEREKKEQDKIELRKKDIEAKEVQKKEREAKAELDKKRIEANKTNRIERKYTDGTDEKLKQLKKDHEMKQDQVASSTKEEIKTYGNLTDKDIDYLEKKMLEGDKTYSAENIAWMRQTKNEKKDPKILITHRRIQEKARTDHGYHSDQKSENDIMATINPDEFMAKIIQNEKGIPRPGFLDDLPTVNDIKREAVKIDEKKDRVVTPGVSWVNHRDGKSKKGLFSMTDKIGQIAIVDIEFVKGKKIFEQKYIDLLTETKDETKDQIIVAMHRKVQQVLKVVYKHDSVKKTYVENNVLPDGGWHVDTVKATEKHMDKVANYINLTKELAISKATRAISEKKLAISEATRAISEANEAKTEAENIKLRQEVKELKDKLKVEHDQ
jgi:hypothetical protein